MRKLLLHHSSGTLSAMFLFTEFSSQLFFCNMSDKQNLLPYYIGIKYSSCPIIILAHKTEDNYKAHFSNID